MSFRLVPKSVTLNDLERRNGRYFTLFRRIRVSSVRTAYKSSRSLSHLLRSSCIVCLHCCILQKVHYTLRSSGSSNFVLPPCRYLNVDAQHILAWIMQILKKLQCNFDKRANTQQNYRLPSAELTGQRSLETRYFSEKFPRFESCMHMYILICEKCERHRQSRVAWSLRDRQHS